MEKRIVTNSEQKTISLGHNFSRLLKKGDVLALRGDLAAGKTTLIKGICKGLGVTQDVESPTFTLINEYSGHLPVYHIDCYREHSIRGWIDIGIEEYLYSDGITFIEWASMIEELLPQDRIDINIEQNFDDQNWRGFTFTFPDSHSNSDQLARLSQ
ncbi:MAG TPA: tRNA (adenosine(37)-N6)-threonylcarbamoyltransferase complex ATPase subunit type 1 TsaE [bacterium]|nr:tRNA (adenosine(37)-N6)-threonylcarbamoyltransferase complex ATPase subunit type 1 TsaE [bacterium]